MRQELNLGAAPGDDTGDTLRDGGGKINDNFIELYAFLGGDALPTPLFSGDYGDLTNVPSSFAPSAHTHSANDIYDATFFTISFITGVADAAGARTALELGNSATRNVGSAGSDVAAGDVVSIHEAASDPHPQYLTVAEGDAAYAALAHASRHQNGGADEIDVTGLSGLLADAQVPLTENVQDIIGAMVTGNTETGIAVTYDDSDGTLDFVLDTTGDWTGTFDGQQGTFYLARGNHTGTQTASTISDLTEVVQDIVGAMVTGNTETNITVTYDDTDGTLDFVVSGGSADGLGPDGDKGDITVGGTGTTLTIDNSAVTLAKMADLAQSTFIGREAGAGTGVPTALSVAQMLTALGAFSGVTIQVFTATGANTYTPTSGMKFCIALTTAAGGGGGGADVTGAADAGAGAGGGAGGTCIEAFSAATIGASQTVTIGTGGTAGTNTGGTGGTGGNTTFGALHTANGGVGGAGRAASTANVQVAAGGAGGAPSGGTANITGGTGNDGFALLTLDATDTNEIALAVGGHGGASMWGGGGRGGANAQDAAAADSTAGSQAGSNGAAPGSGGGGGAVLNTATGVTGGTGANGFCVVIEFT